MCALQAWFLAEEDLRTATPERGGLAPLPALLVNHCKPAHLCWGVGGLQTQKKERRALVTGCTDLIAFAARMQVQHHVLDVKR